MRFDDAKVLITGGSSGIGLATARILREAGARVAICGRDAERLQRAAEEVGAVPIQADVSREPDVERLVAETIEKLGGYDVLVNNAGYGHFAPLVQMKLADFERLMATNVTGAMLVARESARHFVSQNRGHIVNVSSTSGLRGGKGSSAYSASKFALRAMTECWRAELRPHNIRVILIQPSEVVTRFAASAGHSQEDSERKLQPEDIAHAIHGTLAMHERGLVAEVTVFATNPPGLR